ncbi:MAG: hypothetical protein IJY18_01275 [Clostridia bacterium]|nr:hypothetical protein [Clostridia bacterium]
MKKSIKALILIVIVVFVISSFASCGNKARSEKGVEISASMSDRGYNDDTGKHSLEVNVNIKNENFLKAVRNYKYEILFYDSVGALIHTATFTENDAIAPLGEKSSTYYFDESKGTAISGYVGFVHVNPTEMALNTGISLAILGEEKGTVPFGFWAYFWAIICVLYVIDFIKNLVERGFRHFFGSLIKALIPIGLIVIIYFGLIFGSGYLARVNINPALCRIIF